MLCEWTIGKQQFSAVFPEAKSLDLQSNQFSSPVLQIKPLCLKPIRPCSQTLSGVHLPFLKQAFTQRWKSLGFPLPMTTHKGLSQRHGNIPVCHVRCGSGQPPSQIETALVASAHAFVARSLSDVMILVLVADMQV